LETDAVLEDFLRVLRYASFSVGVTMSSQHRHADTVAVLISMLMLNHRLTYTTHKHVVLLVQCCWPVAEAFVLHSFVAVIPCITLPARAGIWVNHEVSNVAFAEHLLLPLTHLCSGDSGLCALWPLSNRNCC
jgi:hypothetical protein